MTAVSNSQIGYVVDTLLEQVDPAHHGTNFITWFDEQGEVLLGDITRVPTKVTGQHGTEFEVVEWVTIMPVRAFSTRRAALAYVVSAACERGLLTSERIDSVRRRPWSA